MKILGIRIKGDRFKKNRTLPYGHHKSIDKNIQKSF